MSDLVGSHSVGNSIAAIGALLDLLRQRIMYAKDQPFTGIVAQGWIGDKPVPRPPWGPFKDANDAVDYVNAKRRVRRGQRAVDPQSDSVYFCDDNFRMEFITQAEFLARIAMQIAQLAGSIAVQASALAVQPATAELEPFSRNALATVVNLREISHDPPVS